MLTETLAKTGLSSRNQRETTAVNLTQTRLVVFLTRGMSFAAWEKLGMLERELALYRRLKGYLGSLAFVSYGDRSEADYGSRLGAKLLTNRYRLGSNLYSIVAPLLHASQLQEATIFKTNQLNGAWTGVLAKLFFQKKLIVRCGFIWSDFYARVVPNRLKQRFVKGMEQWVLRYADRIVVATQSDRQSLLRRGIPEAKMCVVPNYVDTQRFKPMPEIAKEHGLLCFVGRLEQQKNPLSLLEAIRGLHSVRLILVGQGFLHSKIRQCIQEWRLPVTLLDAVPNEQLPQLFNRCQAFILPSHFEGHPKVLLEAMACGCAVIGADSPGIREVVIPRVTGLCCGVSAASIRQAIVEVLRDDGLRQNLGEQAKRWVEENCSLSFVFQKELKILQELSR